MKFIPNSSLKNEILKEMNLKNIDELFSDITPKIKINELGLEKGLSQQETEKKLLKIAEKNKTFQDYISFLGGGIKQHYIPAVVTSIISRSEFYTAYTPYQSEASQGFLQAMFEYQSIIAELTGMDVANCSLYDGVTAISEAALMCSRITNKKTFLMPNNISWEKKCVLKNYTKGPGINIIEIPYDINTGKIDIGELENLINKDVAGVYVENPNFFGIFEEDVLEISKIVKNAGSLLVAGIDPISLGILKNPGEYGADIVVGEGRALGNPVDFGGSTLGIFACKNDIIRNMPGRIIGMTTDKEGKRSFCMTLQTREQHIRRGKATSNICTNEGLNALTALVYIAWLGSNGLEEISRTNFENGQKLTEKITNISGFELMFKGTHFNEFVIKCKDIPKKINYKLQQKEILGGLDLENFFPDLKNCMLFGISEIHSDKDIEKLIKALKEV
jgi:glycine dehydrogenase subunit 1